MAESLKALFKKEFILLLLISLFFVNIYESFTYITIVLLFYVFLYHKKIKLGVDLISLLLLAFGITYVLGNVSKNILNEGYFFLWIIICPYLLYRIGLYIGKLIDSEECILGLILYISILFSFIFLASIYFDILLKGFETQDRSLHIFMKGDNSVNTLRAATGISTMISPLLIYLPTLLFTRKGGLLKILLIGSVFSILSIIGALRVSTRFPFFIISILSLITILYNYKSMSIMNRLSVLVFLIFISYFIYFFNFGEFNLTSALYSRITNSEDLFTFGSRSTRWIDGLENIFKYPRGGDYMLKYKYYHNLWLDTYRVSGIIPMVILLLFTFKSIGVILQTNHNSFSLRGRTIIISIFVIFLSVFFIEPIIEGAFIYFLLYCFLFGLIKSYNLQA